MRILLLGASGLAGGVLCSHFVAGGHDVVGTQHSAGVPELVRLDLLDDAALTELALGPFDLVVHAAGLVDLVPAEAQPQLAWRMNVRSVEVLLTALERSRAKLVFLSGDNVFDGTRETYRERDEPSPITVYGETKVAAERLVLRDPRHLVLRIPMLYGASPFSNKFLGRFARPRTLAQVDVVCAPLYLPSLAAGIPDLWSEPASCTSAARRSSRASSSCRGSRRRWDSPARWSRCTTTATAQATSGGPGASCCAASTTTSWARIWRRRAPPGPRPRRDRPASMGSHRERMLGGEAYLPDDPQLAADRLRCRLLVERFNATSAADGGAAAQILDELLGSIGEDAFVTAPLWCDYGSTISIGARSFLNFGTVILDGAAVSIGADVQIGPGVQLLTATHPLDSVARRRGWESAEPVSIGDGAWLGGGVIVCPGVSIGADAVVGAGSVVTRDVPPGHLAVGNPCRAVRDLSQRSRPAT